MEKQKSIKWIFLVLNINIVCFLHGQTDLTLNGMYNKFILINQVNSFNLTEGLFINKQTFERNIIKDNKFPEIEIIDTLANEKSIYRAKIIYKNGIDPPSISFIKHDTNIYLGVLRSVMSSNINYYFIYTHRNDSSFAFVFEFNRDSFIYDSITEMPIVKFLVYKNDRLKGSFVFINNECEQAKAYKLKDAKFEGWLKKEEIANLKLSNKLKISSYIQRFCEINYENVIEWDEIYNFDSHKENLFNKPYSKYKEEDTIFLEKFEF